MTGKYHHNPQQSIANVCGEPWPGRHWTASRKPPRRDHLFTYHGRLVWRRASPMARWTGASWCLHSRPSPPPCVTMTGLCSTAPRDRGIVHLRCTHRHPAPRPGCRWRCPSNVDLLHPPWKVEPQCSSVRGRPFATISLRMIQYILCLALLLFTDDVGRLTHTYSIYAACVSTLVSVQEIIQVTWMDGCISFVSSSFCIWKQARSKKRKSQFPLFETESLVVVAKEFNGW